ncbi:MAG: SpoIIE family protein phosphatase, partial [Bacteroidales bacterium]|nr:SpoIIE family protein phosphatase [Bacteroidales bacterium]
RQLADEAGYIASGNLDHPLPPAGRDDEIGLLNRSFRNMQSSLVRHIRELTEATAAQERLARELQIARNIQMGMVPHTFPERADVDLFASMMPAKEVGGDLYDFFIQGEKLYFCVGDVSGKGIPASLFMAVSRGMFRVVAGQELPPAEIARRINDAVSEENEMMLFVTMFIGVIDLSTGTMDYCNCGHNAPVLLPCDGGQARFLECIPNTAIGIVSGFSYEGQRIDDVRGKAIFVYTDGLNEAEDAVHSQFGNERMISELGCEPFTDARGLITRMEQAVTVHVAGADPSDDLTMLCVKFG